MRKYVLIFLNWLHICLGEVNEIESKKKTVNVKNNKPIISLFSAGRYEAAVTTSILNFF